MSFAKDVPEDAATVERLAAIKDPAALLAEAGEVAAEAYAVTMEAKDYRNYALALLHLQREWKKGNAKSAPKAPCYRLGQMNRWTFDDVMDTMPGYVKTDPAEVDWDDMEARGTMDDLARFYRHLLDLTDDEIVEIARSKTAEYRTQTGVWRAAARFRDRVALELMNGEHGVPWPNADVARSGRMKTSYVSDLRLGKKQVA
jgi:hypothetical protein